MNLWVKADPYFDSDEGLDAFLQETHGLLMMFDATTRYNF
jgi:hypothetical protein